MRKTFLVTIDLDPVPGAFNTEESAMSHLHGILENTIPHYNPEVLLAPDALQPINEKVMI